jgi:hypothetical protein
VTRIATSCEPSVIWLESNCPSFVDTWSLPPTTWYFSFDGPKIRRFPWPE